MGTKFVDEAKFATRIAEGEEALRQDFHTHRRAIGFRKLLRQQDRQPVAAE